MSKKITEIYAVICPDDGTGNEGIPAFSSGNLMFPMVGADTDRIDSFKQVLARPEFAGRRYEIRRFSAMETLEIIET